jgi:hypothetical protein
MLPHLAPTITLPLVAHCPRPRVSGAPAALGRPDFREERA